MISAAACFLAARPGGPDREAGQPYAPAGVAERAEAQLGVGLVVAAQDGGAGLGSLDLPQGCGQGGEVRVAEGQPLPGGGPGPAGQRRLGDHGERPLRAGQEPPQVGPGGRARHRAAAQDLAVRQDRGQPEQHVLDRAEPGGGLPGRRRGDPAADRGDRDRLRVVAGGQAAPGEFVLQAVAAHPGLDVDRLGDGVDRADAVHPGQVEDDGLRLRLRAAADAGAPAPLGMTAVPVWLAQARTVATSSVRAGKRIARGSGRSSPRARRSSASDQESMAWLCSVCGSVLTVPPGRRLTRMSRGLTRRIVDRGRPDRPAAGAPAPAATCRK